MIELSKITKQSRMIILLCLFYSFLSAQVNLVPNPSFEDSTGIPVNHTEFYKCISWYTVLGSVDYYSKYSPVAVTLPTISVNIPANCFGYQQAKSGNFYAGIYIRAGFSSTYPFFNYHECIGVKLNQKLIANHSYSFTMYVSLADRCVASNQLQAMFSINQFTISNSTNWYDTTSYLNNYPFQVSTNENFINDTANWVSIRRCFIAQGGEEYLTIGNFKDGIHTSVIPNISSAYACSVQQNANNASYIYIDDVSLYDIRYCLTGCL